MSSTTASDPVAVDKPFSDLPTPDPSSTATAATKKKKKKKGKKAASAGGAPSPADVPADAPATPPAPSTPDLGTVDEDDDAPEPSSPDAPASPSDLPPTPMSASGILPLPGEPAAAVEPKAEATREEPLEDVTEPMPIAEGEASGPGESPTVAQHPTEPEIAPSVVQHPIEPEIAPTVAQHPAEPEIAPLVPNVAVVAEPAPSPEAVAEAAAGAVAEATLAEPSLEAPASDDDATAATHPPADAPEPDADENPVPVTPETTAPIPAEGDSTEPKPEVDGGKEEVEDGGPLVAQGAVAPAVEEPGTVEEAEVPGAPGAPAVEPTPESEETEATPAVDEPHADQSAPAPAVGEPEVAEEAEESNAQPVPEAAKPDEQDAPAVEPVPESAGLEEEPVAPAVEEPEREPPAVEPVPESAGSGEEEGLEAVAVEEASAQEAPAVEPASEEDAPAAETEQEAPAVEPASEEDAPAAETEQEVPAVEPASEEDAPAAETEQEVPAVEPVSESARSDEGEAPEVAVAEEAEESSAQGALVQEAPAVEPGSAPAKSDEPVEEPETEKPTAEVAPESAAPPDSTPIVDEAPKESEAGAPSEAVGEAVADTSAPQAEQVEDVPGVEPTAESPAVTATPQAGGEAPTSEQSVAEEVEAYVPETVGEGKVEAAKDKDVRTVAEAEVPQEAEFEDAEQSAPAPGESRQEPDVPAPAAGELGDATGAAPVAVGAPLTEQIIPAPAEETLATKEDPKEPVLTEEKPAPTVGEIAPPEEEDPATEEPPQEEVGEAVEEAPPTTTPESKVEEKVTATEEAPSAAPDLPDAEVGDDDVVMVGHDEAGPGDVAAAEAAVVLPVAAKPDEVVANEQPTEEPHQDKIQDPSHEIDIDPVPVLGAEAIHDHAKLDRRETHENTEPTVATATTTMPEELNPSAAQPAEDDPSKEATVDPAPATGADSIHDHVKLDKDAYESGEPTVPPLELLASGTPVQEAADTAAEVADVAGELDRISPDEQQAADTAADVADVAEELDRISPDEQQAADTAAEVADVAGELDRPEDAGEVKVDPLPAAGAGSVHDHVKLDKDAYESREPTVLPLELVAEGRKSDTPIQQVAETAADVADVAKELDKPEVEVDAKLDEAAYESRESTAVPPLELVVEERQQAAEADVAQELDRSPELERKIDPFPASENAENPLQLQPGEEVPRDFSAQSFTKHLRLDRESYESSEPTVAVLSVGRAAEEEEAEPLQAKAGLPPAPETTEHAKLDREGTEPRAPEEAAAQEQEVKVSPLPAFENAENPIQLQPGEPIPPNATASSVPNTVRLDKASYESAEPTVPLRFTEAERKSDTPIQEVAETAAEVADVAQKLDGSETIGDSTPEVAKQEEPGAVEQQIAAEEAPEGAPVEEESSEARAAVGAVAATAAAVAYSKPTPTAAAAASKAAPANETNAHQTPDGNKVTEMVDESTAHRKPGEEIITEPAPQDAPSSVNGKVVPEARVPEVLAETQVGKEAAPTVVVSGPPAAEGSSDAAASRTVEIVMPTPAEASPEGIRKRKVAGESTPQNRPTSSGSDIVSARAPRNIMHTFWRAFFFGWLGRVGHFFGGMFNRKKKRSDGGTAS